MFPHDMMLLYSPDADREIIRSIYSTEQQAHEANAYSKNSSNASEIKMGYDVACTRHNLSALRNQLYILLRRSAEHKIFCLEDSAVDEFLVHVAGSIDSMENNHLSQFLKTFGEAVRLY